MKPSEWDNCSSIGQSFGFSCDGTLRFSNAMRFIAEKRQYTPSIGNGPFGSGKPVQIWIASGKLNIGRDFLACLRDYVSLILYVRPFDKNCRYPILFTVYPNA